LTSPVTIAEVLVANYKNEWWVDTTYLS